MLTTSLPSQQNPENPKMGCVPSSSILGPGWKDQPPLGAMYGLVDGSEQKRKGDREVGLISTQPEGEFSHMTEPEKTMYAPAPQLQSVARSLQVLQI